MESSHFAKNSAEASWNQFRQFVTYKKEETGRELGIVNRLTLVKYPHNADIPHRGILSSVQYIGPRPIGWPRSNP